MQKFLYHGSTNKDLKVLQPVFNANAPEQGKHVFATTRKDYAAIYLLPHVCGPMYVDTDRNPVAVFINSSLQAIKKHDKGGAIYTVSSDGFVKTVQPGLEESELINPKSVNIIKIERYPSAISAFKQMGIELYSINNHIYAEIEASPTALEYSYLIKNSKRLI